MSTDTKTEPATDVITEIRRLHREIGEALRASLDGAMRIGELLATQKAALPYGTWGSWVRDNCEFTDRTARNYMRLSDNRDRIIEEGTPDIASAYRFLSPAKTETLSDSPLTADEQARLDELEAVIEQAMLAMPEIVDLCIERILAGNHA